MEKTNGQQLSETLSYDTKQAWSRMDEGEMQELNNLCEAYKVFLDKSKTEREFVDEAISLLKQNGFLDVDVLFENNQKLQPGMKVYQIYKNKTIAASVIGTLPIEKGLKIIGAHIDSPRIDLKPNPLYEAGNLSLLKTHYYGGIKKYQWVTIPLSMHGVVIKKDGSKVNICIGEEEGDPVFTITDLLPHLAQDQLQKKLSEGITGEGLNILVGSIPLEDDKVKEKIKLQVLKILNEKYGMVEEDFLSSEIEFVPKFKASDVGLDRSMIGSYGQDDRVCAYTAFQSILDAKAGEKTTVCLLTDKEEIGSVGNTGAQSMFFENYVSMLVHLMNEDYNEFIVKRCLASSKMLSADVSAAYDPTYDSVYDKQNTPFFRKRDFCLKIYRCKGEIWC
jgi:aspartyl aminopeptidase